MCVRAKSCPKLKGGWGKFLKPKAEALTGFNDFLQLLIKRM
jgi:hypothetical protein